MIKKIMLFVLLSSLTVTTLDAACAPMSIKSDAYGQARSLVARYDQAQRMQEKECIEKNMRNLVRQLKEQSRIFGAAMAEEASGGELEASIVNEQEQVDIKKAIAVYEQKLSQIDSGKKRR